VERRPYQNPQQGQQPYQAPSPVYPAPQRDHQHASHAPYEQRSPQAVPNSGNSAYPQPATPYQQPGQFAGSPPPAFSRRRRRRGGCTIALLVVVVLLVIVGIIGANILQHVSAFGSHIMVDKNRSPLSSDNGYMNTSERTNLLVMGYGGGIHDGAYLTDSLLTVSLLPQSHHTSLVSVPRDLYVQYPPNSGQYTRINAIYEFASNNDKNPEAGGSAVTQKIALVTGLNVKYWLTIDFTGFKKVIDSIGGIDVYVPDSFNACYPKNDDAAVDPSWIKVQFNKGMQHMDGATAITYARAREPAEICGGTTQNQAELTDFGRSARQQIIVKAVLSQIKQTSTWPRIYSAMDALQNAIHTNMSLADLSAFALKMDLNDPKAAHIGLSNQNVLQVNPDYTITAANGDWAAIPTYIKEHLYN
jgi:LCP family protein required for cell wall assembly